MPSKFGGVPVEETGSKFGGIPLESPESVPTQSDQSGPGNHGLGEFITSPHGYIREGLRTAGQGVKELFTPGQRMRGATDVLKGAGSVATPAALGAGGAALAAAPLATVGALGLGAAGSGLGGMAGRKLATAVSSNPDAPELGQEVGSLAGGAGLGYAGAKAIPAIGRMIPTTEKAGARIQNVMNKAGDLPVNVSEIGPAAVRAAQFGKRGASTPKAINDFIAETGVDANPQAGLRPLPLRSAADYHETAGRKARTMMDQPVQGSMIHHLNEFRQPLRKAMLDTAEQGEPGLGSYYDRALKSYGTARRIEDFKGAAGDAIKKYGVRSGLAGLGIGGGIYGARKLFGEFGE